MGARMIGGPDVQLSRLAKNRGRTALSMFAAYAGAAEPVGDLLLLRRVIQAFKLRQRAGPAGIWTPASPKSGPKRSVDSYLFSKREYVVAEVVGLGPDVAGIAVGDRVVLQTNASLACPGCGRSADRRVELDADRLHACARCGTRWRRDDGLNVGGCGFNPQSDTEGPLYMRRSTYEVFHHASAVLAVQRGGEGDMIEPGSVVEVRGERLLVRRVPEVEKVGQIHLPEVHREKPVVADVVAVGSGGKFSVGQRVLFGKFAGVEVDIGGEEHVILREEDVLAVITPPAAPEVPAGTSVGADSLPLDVEEVARLRALAEARAQGPI